MDVEDEWDREPETVDTKDLLFVTYNADKVSVQKLLETIRLQGFEAEICDQ